MSKISIRGYNADIDGNTSDKDENVEISSNNQSHTYRKEYKIDKKQYGLWKHQK